jgi:DNA-binding response OmpR family regulator
MAAHPRAHELRPSGSPSVPEALERGASRGNSDVARPPLSVAILDADSGFLTVVANRLERLGWKLRPLAPPVTTRRLRSVKADVLVIDLAVLGPQRWKTLARLCQQPELHVIVCSGPSTVGERITALGAGADDWLNKPCHAEELVARIEAVAGYRRPFVQAAIDSLWVCDLEIRPHQYQAFVAGVSVRLTRREYQLIEVLARAEGKIIAREDVYRAIWNADMEREDRSVDVLVHKVRRKLERASSEWAYIHTHYGHGYRLAPTRTLPEVGPIQFPCRAPEPAALAA